MRHHLLEWAATDENESQIESSRKFINQSATPNSKNLAMLRIFTEHPTSVNETYFEHMRFAQAFGGQMVLGGLGCLVHAVFPFLFVTTGSRTVRRLHQVLLGCAHRAAQQGQASLGTSAHEEVKAARREN